jgi:hypothetical protein
MNREILGYILGVAMLALLVTVIVLAALKMTKNNDGPGLISDSRVMSEVKDIPMSEDTPMPVDYNPADIQIPDISKLMTMSSFSSPNEQLEEEYLKTLNFVEKLYYRTLGSSERQTRLAKFSISKPELLGNILDKFKNQ